MGRALAEASSDHSARAAQHHIETYVRSLFAVHGLPSPGSDQLGQLVHTGMALIPPGQRSPDRINPASISQLNGMVLASVEAGRPRNLYGAEAARAAPASSGTDGPRVAGFGSIEALRAASSARFRELGSSESGTKGGSATSGSGLTGTGGVTAEFARSFAGTGLSGGTLRTFAEVGLDRGTFNAFRREGFSQAQITDNARDVKAIGWQGKDDLSIAQHASTDVRKAAVATEQAKTAERREACRQRERELEQRNEARPDSDPQKQHDRRFFERRHQDHLRHSVKAGLGSESRQHDSGLGTPKDKPTGADHRVHDGRAARFSVKSVSSFAARDQDDFGTAATPASAPAKPAPVKLATAKPAAPAQG